MNKQDKGNGKRGVEWTQYSWNPVAGCQHGCRWKMPDGAIAECYAETVAERVAGRAYPHGFEHHYWHPDILDEPLKLKIPSKIFVGSMADVFGHWVPDDQIRRVLDVCRRAHWHTFQFLTKAAPRLRQFDFPENCWIGASVPPSIMMGKPLTLDQQRAMLRTTLGILATLRVPVRWLSIEPISFDVSGCLDEAYELYGQAIQWAVIGAASNGAKVYQPNSIFVHRAKESLRQMGAAIFYKGNLDGNPAAQPWLEEFPAPKPAPMQLGMF